MHSLTPFHKKIVALLEMSPTNSIGTGNIAGGGYNGPDDIAVKVRNPNLADVLRRGGLVLGGYRKNSK